MIDIDKNFPSKLENLLSNVENPSNSNLLSKVSVVNSSNRKSNQGNENNSYVVSDVFVKNLEFRRWLVLFTFVLLNFLNGLAWGTYSSIIQETKEYFSVNASQVGWFVYQYYIIYVVFSFPVNILFIDL